MCLPPVDSKTNRSSMLAVFPMSSTCEALRVDAPTYTCESCLCFQARSPRVRAGHQWTRLPPDPSGQATAWAEPHIRLVITILDRSPRKNINRQIRKCHAYTTLRPVRQVHMGGAQCADTADTAPARTGNGLGNTDGLGWRYIKFWALCTDSPG